MDDIKIIFETKPSEKEIAFLERQLPDFNCSNVDGYAYERFIIKGIDGPDSKIAGIHGQIGGGMALALSNVSEGTTSTARILPAPKKQGGDIVF